MSDNAVFLLGAFVVAVGVLTLIVLFAWLVMKARS